MQQEEKFKGGGGVCVDTGGAPQLGAFDFFLTDPVMNDKAVCICHDLHCASLLRLCGRESCVSQRGPISTQWEWDSPVKVNHINL